MFYKNLTVIEIENSTICNARCPQCLREELTYEGITYEETFLPTNFFNEMIPDAVYKNLKRIHFAGTLGDPCAAPNFLEVIRVIKNKNNNINITISTNGGLKSAGWWGDLAEILSPSDMVMFAIDGLEDTNHIYRVNVNWKNLIKNAQSFISKGGTAGWQFIVFKHNQHQTQEAREFAKKLKFKEFILKKSHRFPVSELKGIKIIGSNNVPIEPSTDETYVNEIKFIPNHKTWKTDTKDFVIACDAVQEESIYIDVKGRLFPCCYTAAALYQYTTPAGKLYNQGWDEFWLKFGNDNISLYNKSWNDILSEDFYKEIKRKWTSDDRLSVCTLFCGSNAKSPPPVVREEI